MNLTLYQMKVFFVSALAMTAYASLKELFLFNLSGWEAHAIDITVVSFGFLLASYFFYNKSQKHLPTITWHHDKQWFAATLFEDLDDALIITDKDNLIVAVNPAFTRITGDSSEEVLGKSAKILFSGKYTPEFYAELWNTLTRTGSWEGEIWSRRKDGGIFVEWFAIKQVCDDRGAFSHYLGVLSDINPHNASFERIQHLMNYDVLTGLPNKNLFFNHFQKTLAAAAREDNLTAVLLLKIDKFEQVVAKHGFDMTDLLLKKVSDRLQEVVLRKSDTVSVSRVGGDEFVVLLATIKEVRNALMVAENIREVINEPFEIGGQTLQISVCLGVSVFPEHGKTEEVLLANAQTALDEARYNGGSNRVKLFQKLVDLKPII